MTNHVLVEPITIQAEAEEGTVTAVIRWHNDDKEIIGQAESHFR